MASAATALLPNGVALSGPDAEVLALGSGCALVFGSPQELSASDKSHTLPMVL